MSRSRKDILETESMLARLANLLGKHLDSSYDDSTVFGLSRKDAESLRRISMTLRQWFEHECNGVIQRDGDDCEGKPWWCSSQDYTRRWLVPDRETGARKRLALIMSRYPSLTAYVQGDPRGCALYILVKADVPEGADVGSCYSRGLAVHQ